MKLLLTALAGLSLAGGVAAAPIINHSNTTNHNVGVQHTRVVDLMENVEVSTNQGEKVWRFGFNFLSGETIKSVSFTGGGLKGTVNWGSDNWQYSWDKVDLTVGETKELVRDNNNSGLAKETTLVTISLKRDSGGKNQYIIELYFFTKSYNSFTNASGNWTIGNELTFIS